MWLDCLVVGAGQAGQAMGWQLQRAGLQFEILEAGATASGSWPSCYDSLVLFSPAAYSALPGLKFPGPADAYPHRDEVVAYLQRHARLNHLPIRFGQRVDSVRRIDGGFEIRSAAGGVWWARSLVAASGGFHHPYLPELPGLGDYHGQCLHSGGYRRPQDHAGQRIVVIGSANSAVQIACELADHAEVTLACREPPRFVPQRILGLDFHVWMRFTRLERTRWFGDQGTPVLDSGRYRRALRAGRPVMRPMFAAVTRNGVCWADGQELAADLLLFATGFRPSLPYLSALGALDADGRALQRGGVSTSVPGLFFVGLPMQRNFASATLRGVGPDAAYLLPRLQRHLFSLDRIARAGQPVPASNAPG